ncbi:dodecin family protein [Robiginitalea sediminis]|uniref:dodecin family protein n=1 Tax=Robiginitalea sediminis TaxID=1982593 RepID=UPI000B4B42FE|nr:dodecin family protein [Robiginitalea sediminis]
MSVLKVVEILGNSTVSFEHAIENILKEASVSLREIKSIYVKDMQVTVKDNKVDQYRVNAKITFVVQHNWPNP